MNCERVYYSKIAAFVGLLILLSAVGGAQVVSPVQGGHYSPAVANIRDRATPPPGLFVLWYNAYATSSSFIDRNGDAFSTISVVDGIPYVIAGGGGAPLYAGDVNGGFYHYIYVIVEGDRVIAELVDVSGKVRDRF